MKVRFNERLFGFFGFLGFIGFTPENSAYYMLFFMFFFFIAARPTTKEGEHLSDERWAANLTKASAIAFFAFLLPNMFSVAFLRSADIFPTVTAAIPVAALLTLFLSFYYFDRRGD
jgi:hypothetical protein